jgi:hypothetical protein
MSLNVIQGVVAVERLKLDVLSGVIFADESTSSMETMMQEETMVTSWLVNKTL